MQILDKFERLSGKKIERLYLIVWPTEHEVRKDAVDISVGLTLRGPAENISRVRIIAEGGCCPEVVEFKPGRILGGSSFLKKELMHGWTEPYKNSEAVMVTCARKEFNGHPEYSSI